MVTHSTHINKEKANDQKLLFIQNNFIEKLFNSYLMFQPDDVFEPYLEMNECSFVDKAADFYTEVFYLFLN